jgi:hypothetical protein
MVADADHFRRELNWTSTPFKALEAKPPHALSPLDTHAKGLVNGPWSLDPRSSSETDFCTSSQLVMFIA